MWFLGLLSYSHIEDMIQLIGSILEISLNEVLTAEIKPRSEPIGKDGTRGPGWRHR